MRIENLVETHCHILPAVDDGSQDTETSIKMIQKLQLQGAKKIILTPHYYSDSISLDDFLQKRDAAFENLKAALPPDSPELILAAEVYISKYLFHNDDLSSLCIGDSKYILIEHPFSSTFSQNSYDRLINMYCDYRTKPILAHIERYRPLMEDGALLDRYIDMGCLVQVNIASFADAPRSIRKRLIKYLESGRIHLIGSDCHNLTSRPPDYSRGAKVIIEKCGRGALNRLIENANELVK